MLFRVGTVLELPETVARRRYLRAAVRRRLREWITLSVPVALIYFLPTIVMQRIMAMTFAGVLLLNLFFGWTGIGWLAMMLWALLSAPRYYLAPAPQYYPYAGWRR